MSETERPPQHFANPNHALTAGMVWGLLMRHGINALPEVDDYDNYTAVIHIEYDGYEFRVEVLP
jgi:hypothetical protein